MKSLLTQQLPWRKVCVRSPSCSCPQPLALTSQNQAGEWPYMMTELGLRADAQWSRDKLGLLSPAHCTFPGKVNVFWVVSSAVLGDNLTPCLSLRDVVSPSRHNTFHVVGSP